jgi:PadR family transcriptional regulator
MNELDRHGYRLSPGTLYPLLHNLEESGLLARDDRTADGKVRKYYMATAMGRLALAGVRSKALDLVDEINGRGADA